MRSTTKSNLCAGRECVMRYELAFCQRAMLIWISAQGTSNEMGSRGSWSIRLPATSGEVVLNTEHGIDSNRLDLDKMVFRD